MSLEVTLMLGLKIVIQIESLMTQLTVQVLMDLQVPQGELILGLESSAKVLLKGDHKA